MDFSEALNMIKDGKMLYRSSWDACKLGRKVGVYASWDPRKRPITLVYEDQTKKFTNINWTPSTDDLMATDWEELL